MVTDTLPSPIPTSPPNKIYYRRGLASIDDAAVFMNTSPHTVREMVRAGRLPTVRLSDASQGIRIAWTTLYAMDPAFPLVRAADAIPKMIDPQSLYDWSVVKERFGIFDVVERALRMAGLIVRRADGGGTEFVSGKDLIAAIRPETRRTVDYEPTDRTEVDPSTGRHWRITVREV